MNQIKLLKNKIISNELGSIYKFISTNSLYYKGFKESYFTSVKYRKIKGWNYHKKITCNIIVIKGKIEFSFKDEYFNDIYLENKKLILSDNLNYRLVIPPKIWFSFKGKKKGENIILNLTNKIYDKTELLKKKII
tara:strand:+ start:324 stop:728 length:405 start_codon:yes stop_codon:yes gene_type:complete